MTRLGNGSVRHARLQDLLPDSVIRKIEPIMNDIAEGKIDISEGKKQLSKLIDLEKAQLEQKGVLADYLAWMLAGMASKSGGHLGSISVN